MSQDIITLMLTRAANGHAGGDYADADNYDWSRPHSFPQALLAQVQELMDRAAEQLADALSKIVRGEVAVKAGDVLEVYAADLAKAASDDARLFIPLATADGRPCGYISTPGQNAVQWVAKLLGGSDAEADREMSALELSLLGDVMASLGTALLAPICSAGGVEITPGRNVTSSTAALGDDSAEFVEVDFSLADEDEQPVLTAVIGSAPIAAAVSGERMQASGSEADVRKNLIGQISHVSVTAVAHLGQTRISVREAAALGVGDVVVLDVCLGDQVGLFVQGKKVAMGTPVSCEGNNAIRLTEMVQAASGDDTGRGGDENA